MRRFVGWTFGFIFVAAGIFALLNYQYVIDYSVASQYKPSVAETELADQVQFSERGDFLFRATQTKLNDAPSFNRNCQKKDEQSVVLGCYIGPQKVYVYDVNDSRLSGIKPVTAAHEVLHAAYDRLAQNERDRVNQLIEQALPEVMNTKSDLADRLVVYEKTEPGERSNELHSILGSEAETLPTELENYYKQYFKNRQIITTFAASYSKVFNDIKTNQEALVAELKALSDEIDTLTNEYNDDAEQLRLDVDSFNSRANIENGFNSQEEFNTNRARLTQRLQSVEANRQTVINKVALYEEKRTQLEALNVQVEELNSKLDSTKLPSL